MERIGIAASRMAKGNLLKYNLFVVAISTLFALLLFLVSGFVVLLALLLISIAMRWFLPQETAVWTHIAGVAVSAVAIIIGILNVLAVVKNIKIGKNRI